MPKLPRCSRQRCTRRPWGDSPQCFQHLRDEADRVFRKMIRERDGYCTPASFYPGTECVGGLQGMHLVPVGYGALRWDPENGAAGCAAHHMYLTEHPIEHGWFCEQWLGTERWEALRGRRFNEPMDPADALRDLKGAAA